MSLRRKCALAWRQPSEDDAYVCVNVCMHTSTCMHANTHPHRTTKESREKGTESMHVNIHIHTIYTFTHTHNTTFFSGSKSGHAPK
jgi:hypothetical protein